MTCTPKIIEYVIMKYDYELKFVPIIGCIGAHKGSIYTCLFIPIYYSCKYQRPPCNVHFFVYIKTIGGKFLVKFRNKPPP